MSSLSVMAEASAVRVPILILPATTSNSSHYRYPTATGANAGPLF